MPLRSPYSNCESRVQETEVQEKRMSKEGGTFIKDSQLNTRIHLTSTNYENRKDIKQQNQKSWED